MVRGCFLKRVVGLGWVCRREPGEEGDMCYRQWIEWESQEPWQVLPNSSQVAPSQKQTVLHVAGQRCASQKPEAGPEEGNWTWGILQGPHPSSEDCLQGWGTATECLHREDLEMVPLKQKPNIGCKEHSACREGPMDTDTAGSVLARPSVNLLPMITWKTPNMLTEPIAMETVRMFLCMGGFAVVSWCNMKMVSKKRIEMSAGRWNVMEHLRIKGYTEMEKLKGECKALNNKDLSLGQKRVSLLQKSYWESWGWGCKK